MKLTLTCPYAAYGERMRIQCKKADGPCAHQHFKSCKGWWVLTPAADDCPLREENKDESETDQKHPDEV